MLIKGPFTPYRETSAFASTALRVPAWGLLASLLVACAPTSSPQVTEISITRPPTFGGQATKTFIVPGPSTVISGECDTAGKALEFSYDQRSWSDVPGGCGADGQFSIPVHANPLREVYVRSRTKTGATPVAQATVHYLPPPTSTAASFGTSSRSDPHEQRGTQNLMGMAFTGIPSANAARSLDLFAPGVVYGK